MSEDTIPAKRPRTEDSSDSSPPTTIGEADTATEDRQTIETLQEQLRAAELEIAAQADLNVELEALNETLIAENAKLQAWGEELMSIHEEQTKLVQELSAACDSYELAAADLRRTASWQGPGTITLDQVVQRIGKVAPRKAPEAGRKEGEDDAVIESSTAPTTPGTTVPLQPSDPAVWLSHGGPLGRGRKTQESAARRARLYGIIPGSPIEWEGDAVANLNQVSDDIRYCNTGVKRVIGQLNARRAESAPNVEELAAAHRSVQAQISDLQSLTSAFPTFLFRMRHPPSSSPTEK